MASVGMDARGEFANPPGGYGLPGRYGPAHTAAARAPVSPYSSSLSRVIGSGGAIAAEPMGPLPHAYGTPVSPAAVSPYSSVAAVSPYAGAVQAQPYSAPVQTWGAPLVSGIQPRPPSAAAPLGSLQPTMPSTTAAPTSGLAPTTVGTAGRAPAGMQTAPISPPVPGMRPTASASPTDGLSYSGPQPSGWFGMDRVDTTGLAGRAARLGTMMLGGPLGAVAGLARAGLNLSNASYANDVRQAMGMEPLSFMQQVGAALGLNQYGSGGSEYAIGRTDDGTPITYSGIAREPTGLLGLLGSGGKQFALTPAEYMAGIRTYQQPTQKTGILTTAAGLPVNMRDPGMQAAMADKAARGPAPGGMKAGGNSGGAASAGGGGAKATGGGKQTGSKR